MENEKISDFLQEQRDEAPEDLQHFFLSFEDFWERKLWHELTDILVTFYAEPQSKKQRLPIYNNFIKSFADKINQLKLVRIGLSTAHQCKGMPDAASSGLTYGLTDLRQTTKNASPSSKPSPNVSISRRQETHMPMP